MSMKHFVISDSFNERVFLKLFHHGRHVTKFGLTRHSIDATSFPNKIKASMYAARAETMIMRRFQAVEIDTKSMVAAE
jgi:hypothetical protein